MTTAAKKTTAKKTEPEFGAGFEKYRERSAKVAEVNDLITMEPFTLGTDKGFTRDYVLAKPSIKERALIQNAMANGDVLNIMRLVFGADADDVLDELDRYENQTGMSVTPILLGLVIEYLEHFYGPGAGDHSFSKLSIF